MESGQFWSNIVSTLSESAVKVVLSALAAIVILVVGFRLIGWFMRRLKKTRLYLRLDPTAQPFFSSLLSVGLKCLLIILLAGVVGVPTASIITLLGSAGVAIGLAMQGSLSNLAGGMMLLLFKPFQKGDFIEVANNPPGTVRDLSVFYTTLVTVDHRVVVIPNGALSNGAMTNYSAMETRRVDLDFSVAYAERTENARRTILAAAAGCPMILPDPAPEVWVTQLSDSAVILQYHGWCKQADYKLACCDVTERVKAAFDAAGLSIPVPQMDVHVKP